MIRIRLLLVSCIIFSITSAQSTSTAVKKSNTITNKYGSWETDQEGNKYREDYELRNRLRGYELVKYTRINGGEFGGGTSTTKFTLCSDGTSKFYHESLTTVSVDGAFGNDGSVEEDYGTWKAIETETGLKVIMLMSKKHNTTGYMEIKLMGGSKIQMVWYEKWQEFFMKKVGC